MQTAVGFDVLVFGNCKVCISQYPIHSATAPTSSVREDILNSFGHVFNEMTYHFMSVGQV